MEIFLNVRGNIKTHKNSKENCKHKQRRCNIYLRVSEEDIRIKKQILKLQLRKYWWNNWKHVPKE